MLKWPLAVVADSDTPEPTTSWREHAPHRYLGSVRMRSSLVQISSSEIDVTHVVKRLDVTGVYRDCPDNAAEPLPVKPKRP